MTRTVLLGDVVEIQKESLNPLKFPDTDYDVFSIPGYDNGAPEKLRGSEIKSNKFVVKSNSILVSKLNPRIPRVWKVVGADVNSVSSTEFVVLRVKPKYESLFDYIYAVLSSVAFSTFLQSRVKGTSGSHQRIKPEDVYDFRLDIDHAQAVAAGEFIKTIDEKIELNRKMNETLEQTGQALFRHYFIDNSEAEKWLDGKVSDIVNIYSGYAFKRTDFDPDGRYGLVTIKNVQDGSFLPECSDHLSAVPEKTPDYAYLQTGDVLLSLTGNVGRVCIAYGKNLLLNQRVAKLVGLNGRNSFAYFMFRQDEFKQKLTSMSRGTAQLNLSPVETKNIKMKLPPENVLEKFYDGAEPIFESITHNYQQIQALTVLRDTLLPRLISGKITLE